MTTNVTKTFNVGDRVSYYLSFPRQYYVPATVVGVTAKRVKVQFERCGEMVVVAANPRNLFDATFAS